MDSAGQKPDDTVHYPQVVLVTGACRFLGGYLTARLAQNPLINRVIAVDAIAPSKDLLRRMGRAGFVRADIRNPFIAKVIRNNDVDTVVHAAAASYSPRSGGKAALKELNVMGAMQLFAACQKAPSVRRGVLKSTAGGYGSRARDPGGFAGGRPTRRRAFALSDRSDRPAGARQGRPAAAVARAGRTRRAGARHDGGSAGHVQHRRRRHHDDVAGDPQIRSDSAAGAGIRPFRGGFPSADK